MNIRQIIREILIENFFTENVDEDTLSRMRDFGMDEGDIDDNGYVTLYHGGIELPERLNPDEIFFLTNNYSYAEEYKDIRGKQNETQGEVFTIKVKPEDVSWNTGSGEIEFDRGGLISRRNGFLTIIPRTDEDINVPINVGDEVLGGKFKNKKIKVKEIGANEKGDITINDKPLLRFRIPKSIKENKDYSTKNVDSEFDKYKNSHFNSLRDFTLNDIVNKWDEIQLIKNDNIDTVKFFINKLNNDDKIDCLIYDEKGLSDGFHRLIAMKIVGIKQFCFILDKHYLG